MRISHLVINYLMTLYLYLLLLEETLFNSIHYIKSAKSFPFIIFYLFYLF